MPIGRSGTHKISALALEFAETSISKRVLNSFQWGVGFLIRWQKL